MDKRLAVWGVVLLVVCGFGAVGCGSAPTQTDRKDEVHMKVLGILYGKYLSQHRGQPPANEAQFVQYLSSTPASWEKIVETPEQLLTSPRDGKPLLVLYGQAYTGQNNREKFWMARESEGVDGQYQVLNIRGDVETMEAQTVNELFPESK